MKEKTIIVVTGPESTGKSVLSRSLSELLEAKYVVEFSRIYLEKNGPAYYRVDFQKMLDGQDEQEKKALESGEDILVFDTDLLTYKIWSEWKYGVSNAKVDQKLLSFTNRIYLLCAPDIEWAEDPLRENPDQRWELFELYRESLEAYGLKYEIVRGLKEKRLDCAFTALKKMSKEVAPKSL